MPIKVNCKNIERIIKTDALGQPTEIMKVYRNNTVVWKKKSPYLPEQLAKMANNVAYLINQERVALGRGRLYVVPHLNECAEIRAEEQVETEGHYRPNGEYFYDVIDCDIVEWLYATENIALGTASAEDTVKYWKNLSNHWANATNSSFTHTGVGVFYDKNSDKLYWAMIYTYDMNPGASYPEQYLPQYIPHL